MLQTSAVVAAAVPLAACGGGRGPSGDASSLSILDYYADDPDNGVFQKALEECAAKVGVTIKR